MPILDDDLFDAVNRLSAEEKLKVAVRMSVSSGVIVGCCAAAGGLLGGPVGIAVGSTVGGCWQALRTSGQFQSVPEILASMTPAQREQLIERLQEVAQRFDVKDLSGLMMLLMTSGDLKMALISTVVNYLRNELHLNVCD